MRIGSVGVENAAPVILAPDFSTADATDDAGEIRIDVVIVFHVHVVARTEGLHPCIGIFLSREGFIGIGVGKDTGIDFIV